MSDGDNNAADNIQPIQDGGGKGADFDALSLLADKSGPAASGGDRISDASLGLPDCGFNSDVSTGLLTKDSSGALQMQAADLGKMISFGGAARAIAASCPKV